MSTIDVAKRILGLPRYTVGSEALRAYRLSTGPTRQRVSVEIMRDVLSDEAQIGLRSSVPSDGPRAHVHGFDDLVGLVDGAEFVWIWTGLGFAIADNELFIQETNSLAPECYASRFWKPLQRGSFTARVIEVGNRHYIASKCMPLAAKERETDFIAGIGDEQVMQALAEARKRRTELRRFVANQKPDRE